MIGKTIKITFILIGLAAFAHAQDSELADAFYKQGEYDKAAELYKKVSGNKDQARQIHNNFLNTLYKLKDYKTAEKFIKNQIKANENNINYKADYAQFLEFSVNPEAGNKEYFNVIEQAAKTDAYVYELQNYFYKANKIDLAVKLMLIARDKTNDPFKFDTQLARAYLYLDMKDKMLEETFGYGLRSRNYSYVQTTIQDNIKDEQEIEMLEKMLYTNIQANPNEIFYNEILIWHLTQKSDFARAFIQARSLDKRLKLEGTKIFELAGLCFQFKDYRNASKMYQYIMDEYPQGEFYAYARRWLIQSKEELVKTTFPLNPQEIKQYDSRHRYKPKNG
jgi:hypothetical protein